MTRNPAPSVPSTGWSAPLHRYDRHRAEVRSKVLALSGDVVVSHLSAAVLHHLPLPSIVLSVVHVTRPDRRAARRSPVLHTHGALLAASDVVLLDGLPVTSVARTVVDCAVLLPFAAAVELTDAALARGLVSRNELAGAARPRMPGITRIREVLFWADPGSRTAWDSRHRLAFAGATALPPQAHVILPLGADGREVCTDVWFPADLVVGVVEDDPDPQAPPCGAPRATADLCRANGVRFLAWGRSDLDRPGVMEERRQQLRVPPNRPAAPG